MKNLILFTLLMVNLLTFADENPSFNAVLNGFSITQPSAAPSKGKIVIRTVANRRTDVSEKILKEGRSETFLGYIRNGYGVPVGEFNVAKNSEISAKVRENITLALRNAGYEVVTSDPAAPVMDIFIFDLLYEGYGWFDFSIGLNIFMYPPDFSKRIFETKIRCNNISLVDSFSSIPIYPILMKSVIGNVVTNAEILFKQDEFNLSVKEGKPFMNTNIYLPKSKINKVDLKDITPETIFSANLFNNDFKNTDSLIGLPNLRIVNLQKNSITKADSLNSLNNLEFINLKNNKLKTVPILKDLKNLKYLSLSKNDLTNLAGIEQLTSLEWLDISENKKLTDISALKACKNLKGLLIYDCEKLTDFTPIAELDKLEILAASKNENLTPEQVNHFSKITTLRELYIGGLDDITTIPDLSLLKNLQILDISFSGISNTANFETIPNVREFYTWGNSKITDRIDGFEKLTSLELFYVDSPDTWSNPSEKFSPKTYEFLNNKKVYINGTLTADEYVKNYNSIVE